MKNYSVRKMIINPKTNKRMRRVFVVDKGWFGWNIAYHVYNSDLNYDQLKPEDIKKIDFSK